MTEINETLLIKKIQGYTDESEDQLIADWLSESEENVKTYTKIKVLWFAGKAGKYSTDRQIQQSIHKINARIDNLDRDRKRIRKVWLLKYAAALVFLIGLGTVIWQTQVSKPTPELLSIENSRGKSVKSAVLPDGTKVWLNHGARLSYPKEFDESQRAVSVEGEVFLEVAKDPGRRFLVFTPAFTVEVTGTSFNVNTDVFGKVEVVLVEGAVNLLGNGDHKIGSLIPGQLASCDTGKEAIEIREVNLRLYTAWQEGLVIFEDKELKGILKKIEEVYEVEFLYDTAKINRNHTKYNFVFRESQSFDTVMEMLKFVAPINDIRVKREKVRE